MEQHKNNNKISEWLTKVKEIKHIKIIIAILIAAICCLLYGTYSEKIKSTFAGKEQKETTKQVTAVYNYSEEEEKLANTLSLIEGVGETKVHISSDRDDTVVGVIVLAEKADDPVVEWKIRHAVMTILKIDYHNIDVYSMK